jgi:hypothetical protein
MATLVLQAAGQAVGGFLGGPVGAMLGKAAGGIAGSLFDQALLGGGGRKIEGPRLKELHLLGSSEGSPINRVYGRVRIAGQVIWATRFEEVVTTRKQRSGGKGGIGQPKTKTTEYSYFANFAIALCEGPINRIGRVWADGKEIDISGFTHRIYTGNDSQQPDSLIIAKQGSDHAPAYRGTAYIVFEHLPLERFGNRLPQLSFEVFKALDDVESNIAGVNIIPGATEFGYEPQPVTRDDGWGGTLPENTHTVTSRSDWSVSLDQLQSTCPNLASASLVVSWFGDDLRCGQTQVYPAIETDEKTTEPQSWSVAGLSRSAARLVSRVNGNPAFGSTPDDASVVNAIRDLTARGIKPVFYPFIMMDIPADTTLSDPYNPSGSQPAYPWRGRMTCNPAPGVAGSPDKTAAIGAQIDRFFGAAQPGDFSISGDQVIYSGPSEWSYRRFVLHYAHLCAIAGGVDAFLIGSELRGLTTLRDEQNHFPVVTALVTLASQVAQILPTTKISYAADWSEYFGFHPQDGSNDVWFHLDELWSSPNVDFIGIDNYMPLSDWRDGTSHLDSQNGASSVYDINYLSANITGGEGFDWYYASPAARELQQRSTISDGAYNKPWVFRYKDIKNWWLNQHFNRPGGTEQATATSWQPQSKPVWFTEAGCPAIDKASNQPNVFHDPKSVESRFPYFSNGGRDDFIQRRYIQAIQQFWRGGPDNNPVSNVFGAPMVDSDAIFIWAWDARPFPAFPNLQTVWSDSDNYQTGHWLNGRLGAAPLGSLVAAILNDYGFADYDVSQVEGVVDGYVIDHTMSARQALEPLTGVFAFDGVESGPTLKFRHRAEPVTVVVNNDRLVESKPGEPAYSLRRSQETDLPNRLQTLFLDSTNDYRQSVVEETRLLGHSQRVVVRQAPVAMSFAMAQAATVAGLHEAWTGRETASFALSASLIALEPGDVVAFSVDGKNRAYRIEEIADGSARNIKARLAFARPQTQSAQARREVSISLQPVFGKPLFQIIDLPMLTGQTNGFAAWLAVRAAPWPGSVLLLEDEGGTFTQIDSVPAPAVIGRTLNLLKAGPVGRIDYGNILQVKLADQALESVSRAQLLAGKNALAVGDQQTGWEIIQFENADLVGDGIYNLSILLRGQSGSDAEMLPERPVGSYVVLLDDTVRQIPASADDFGRERSFRMGPATRDHGDPSFVSVTHTMPALALRPFSPAHLTLVKHADHLTLSWVRRTRRNGDSWAAQEVPLAEDFELYTVEILSGESVVRTLTTSQPQVDYTNADRQNDFASPLPDSLTYRVAQVSSVYGAGVFKEKTFNV